MTNLFATTQLNLDYNKIYYIANNKNASLPYYWWIEPLRKVKKSLYFEKTMFNRLKSLTLR